MNRVFALSMAMSRRAVTPSAGALAPALSGLDRRVRKRHLLEFAQGLFDLQIGVGQGRPSPSACRFTSLKWFTLPLPFLAFFMAIQVLPHVRCLTWQFALALASTYCRTEGHHLPRNGAPVP
jgi:hypothetical protein